MVITAIGYYTFGFEIDGWTQLQNLAVNFAFYGVLVILLFLTPMWYNVIWGSQARLDKRSEKVLKKIETLEDITLRQQTQQLYENNGELPPNRKQVIALIVLFCFFNFELFFINAWVKGEDYHLVWQPDWVNAIIDWMRNNLNLPPVNENKKLFFFKIGDKAISAIFTDEHDLLATQYADTGLFFHFWRFISCPIYLILYVILLWKTIDWLGASRINPKNIQTIGRFLWISVVSIFMLLFLISLIMITNVPLFASFPMILGKSAWLGYQGVNIYYMLTIIALKILIGWFYFWKNIFIKITR